jgi:hypothetical protein
MIPVSIKYCNCLIKQVFIVDWLEFLSILDVLDSSLDAVKITIR